MKSKLAMIGFVCMLCVCQVCNGQDELASAHAAAIQFASQSVVQIETVGGLTPKGQSRSTAPFSGTVVSEDGFILTASYNLLHEPATIFVAEPGNEPDSKRRIAAEIISTDESRNLTLLKTDLKGLTPIRFASLDKLRTGSRAIAIGKSVSIGEPNVSMGIVSAKGRIWNRAIQTDAKISRLNYGGPLVTLTGEAIGILVPMSQSSSEVAAGAQWYDSGIGFAATVDPTSKPFGRFLNGEKLRAGLIGVKFAGQDENADPAIVSFCLPTSPAGKAGLKVGDTIIEANGVPIVRQGQFKHVLGPLYENEALSVAVDRDGGNLEFEIMLAGEIDPYVEPEMGILLQLPSDLPTIVAFIPESPASESDLKLGDQITKINDTEIDNAKTLRQAISQIVVGEPCKLVVKRDDAPVKVSLAPRRQLANLLTTTLARTREGIQQRSFEPIEINVAEGSNKCVAFVPKTDDKQRPKPAVLVWVPKPGPVDQKSMFKKFESFCTGGDTIVLVPESVDPEKWLPDDASVIAKALERLEQRVSFDPNRVAIAGKGSGGEMAVLTAFSNRNVFRGVASIDAELSTAVPNAESLPSSRLHMLLLGTQDNDQSVEFFREKGLSIFESPDSSRIPQSLQPWLQSLDRL